MSGEIGVVFPNITAQVIALHRGGKLRILAVNAPARLDAIADIPTAIEAGLPDFVSQTFFGIFAPAATAKPVLQRIDAATQKEWADAQFQKKLTGAGFEPHARIRARAGRAIPRAGIRPLEPGGADRCGTANR